MPMKFVNDVTDSSQAWTAATQHECGLRHVALASARLFGGTPLNWQGATINDWVSFFISFR
jgi:hypothetical protein